jgi:histidine triad (HIT) family protein
MENCVFCNIVAGKATGRVVYENELSMVILDIHPYAEGHCLAIPKRHVQWWHELTSEENASLFEAAQVVAKRMMKKLKPEFVCMYARGRRIPHTHIFLIPTYSGDVLDRFFNALENFQESPEHLAKIKTPEFLDKAMNILKEE